VTVRQNISQLFDDLDNGNADMLAAGLVYNSERVKNYQAGPTYYSVSQQLVYRVGNRARAASPTSPPNSW
jgi:membrane-bound lytic murein transglycosylase F